ncbi:MAG: sugar phosphate isomerase/epimerase [Ruminococcaceae bacterium]|nr:sugar phosphate isomerase/epimerase [Oscillospiraceae bacterium]
MFDIGISTACFYPMYLEKALERITKFDISVCEIFFNCFSELEMSFVKELKSIADCHGVKVASVHPFLSGLESFLFFSPYDRRFGDGLDIYKKMFEAAQYLGTRYFVLHGAYPASFCGMDEYVRRYNMISDAALQYGIILTHENVSRTVTADADFISHMNVACNSSINYTFDLKQCIRAENDPLRMIEAMGNKIKNVHINDFDFAKKECRLPCDGNCDILSVLKKLKETGYDGNLIIEVYSDNYSSDDDIVNSISKLRELIKSSL